MKKIGIVYNGDKGKDWAINLFRKEFEKRDVQVALFDINQIDEKYSFPQEMENISLHEIQKLIDRGFTIWMNRVYPSESQPKDIARCLNITSWLGARNHTTINPLTATAADYDKFLAYQLMEKYNVPTPKTKRLNLETTSEQFLDEFKFPFIVKRNTGGKSIGVIKVNSQETFKKIYQLNAIRNDLIIQDFAHPIKPYDLRLGVVGGELLISYGRKLLDPDGSGLWMGSVGKGSEKIFHDATDEESRIAVLASNSLGANLNVVDIQLTKKGPFVIENNLTPGYSPGGEKWVKVIVDHFCKKYY